MNKVLIACVVRAAGVIDVAATKTKYESELLNINVEKQKAYDKKLSEEMSASISAFDTDIAKYTAVRADWDQKSATAVAAIFDKYGKSNSSGTITKTVLVNMAAQYLLNTEQIQFSDLKLAQEMIASYVSDNNGTIFSIERGKDGGVRLITAE